jgi:hypothetical protein
MDHDPAEKQTPESPYRRAFLKTAAVAAPAVALLVAAGAKKAAAQGYPAPDPGKDG